MVSKHPWFTRSLFKTLQRKLAYEIHESEASFLTHSGVHLQQLSRCAQTETKKKTITLPIFT